MAMRPWYSLACCAGVQGTCFNNVVDDDVVDDDDETCPMTTGKVRYSSSVWTNLPKVRIPFESPPDADARHA
eukprot:scaffold67182_cov45-Attheya_sp.AAC.1